MSGNVVDHSDLELQAKYRQNGARHFFDLQVGPRLQVQLEIWPEDRWYSAFRASPKARAAFLQRIQEWLELASVPAIERPSPARLHNGFAVLATGDCFKGTDDDGVWLRWKLDFHGPSVNFMAQGSRVLFQEHVNPLGDALLYVGFDYALTLAALPRERATSRMSARE